MMITPNKIRINRGHVHVIANEHGGIYHLTENDNWVVTLRQIETYSLNSKIYTSSIETQWKTDLRSLQEGAVLPGNIKEIVSIQQITLDPEQYLWWEENRVKRDQNNRALYKAIIYYPDPPLQSIEIINVH